MRRAPDTMYLRRCRTGYYISSTSPQRLDQGKMGKYVYYVHPQRTLKISSPTLFYTMQAAIDSFNQRGPRNGRGFKRLVMDL